MIPYKLRFSTRGTLRITVNPDTSVFVDAPESRTIDEVRARLKRRAQWIAKQRDYFLRFKPRPPKKTFQSGETVTYLGRHYRLKVTIGYEARTVLSGRFLKATVTGRSVRVLAVRQAVVAWYLKRAQDVFQRRLETCHAHIKQLRIKPPKLIIRPMIRRWGSFTKNGAIVLNSDLIQAPIHCVDYVIFHELIHALVPNHGPRFYDLLTRFVPDWQIRKVRLETAMSQLPTGVTIRS